MPWVLTRGNDGAEIGYRVAGFISEWWPTSNRNGGRHRLGKGGRHASESADFAPDALMPALQVYRERFQPSEQLERPYAMVGVNVIAAETDGAARRLFTSAQQQFTNLLRGSRGQLPASIDDIDRYWSPASSLW